MTDDHARSRPHDSPRPHLVVVVEAQRPSAGGARYALTGIEEVAIGRGIARKATRTEGDASRLELTLPASAMSSKHATLARRGEDWELVDVGSRNGTLLNGIRTTRRVLADGDTLEMGHVFFRFHARWPTPDGAPCDLDPPCGPSATGSLATLVPTLEARHAELAVAAKSSAPLLLFGEPGTEKERLAGAVHALSLRAGRFVAIDCTTIARDRIDESLSARAHAAEGGTLFIDDVGRVPTTTQATLLRSGVRLVCGSNGPQDSMRPDLLARQPAHTHTLMPLRDRRDDLGVLLSEMLFRLASDRATSVVLDPLTATTLVDHTWPRNTRELEQYVAAALPLAKDGVILPEHLPPSMRGGGTASVSARPSASEDDKLRVALLEHLARERGNVAAAARAMGRGAPQLQRWMKRWGIDPNRYR